MAKKWPIWLIVDDPCNLLSVETVSIFRFIFFILYIYIIYYYIYYIYIFASYIYIYYIYIYIRCTALLPPSSSDIRGFIVKNWLYIYDSKYCPSLAITFSHLSGSDESRIEKTVHLLRWSTYRFNFWLLHKNINAGQLSRVPLVEMIVRESNVWRTQRVG